MIETIHERSPTRIDLAGGTLDFWPLYMFIGGATTVNFAIDIFTECEVSFRDDSAIHLRSTDQKLDSQFESIEDFLASDDKRWCLIKKHLEYWKPKRGVNIRTGSQSPAGGGLGGSSSLSISMLRAFQQLMDKELSSNGLIQVAGNLEARVLHTPTGIQDYYPAVNGGINFIHLNADGVSVEVHRPPLTGLSDRFFVVYTGHPHHSGMCNWAIIKSAVEKDEKVLGALNRLKEVAEDVELVIKQNQWGLLGDLLAEEYDARIQLAPSVLCPEIEKLHQVAFDAGAQALKICGAGGGGCVIVWADPNRLDGVRDACSEQGFQILDANPVSIDPSEWN